MVAVNEVYCKRRDSVKQIQRQELMRIIGSCHPYKKYKVCRLFQDLCIIKIGGI